jgi:ankyrin repeat protein
LCKHGYNIEDRDQDGRTPIHTAALYNQVEVIEELIALKANLESVDDMGYTPLLAAASKDNIEAFRVLWDWCLITAISFFGDSVLMVAVKNNAMQCIKFLLVKENHTAAIWKKIEQVM